MNEIDLNGARRKRDRRLRKRILSVLRLAIAQSQTGELDGRTLVDTIDGVMGRGQRFESDEHAITLLREMAAKGLIEERDTRRYPKEQAFGLDRLAYKVTAAGHALWNESLPPDPDVDDPRLGDEE